jgi:tetratricopeptide (TPR) repeat protein
MPTLRRWIEQEYHTLAANGKPALVDAFDRFTRAFFDFDYAAVMTGLPRLYELAETLREPVWRLLTQYYEINAEIYWLGNLKRGLELATQSVIQAHDLLGARAVPTFYFQEILLYAWLETDGPGYADDVLQAVDEAVLRGPEADITRRYRLLQARGLAQNGSAEEAATLILSLLPELDWPGAHIHSLRADALALNGRTTEAIASYRAALAGFEATGEALEANSARLGLGEALVEADQIDEGLGQAQTAHQAASRLPNKLHRGLAARLIGRALAEKGRCAEAQEWVENALNEIEGLGWLRTEAALALEHVSVLRQAGINDQSARWKASVQHARRLAGRLRSGDLKEELDRLVDG